jgi:GH24 family phage-related lysozyme (muramidase)
MRSSAIRPTAAPPVVLGGSGTPAPAALQVYAHPVNTAVAAEGVSQASALADALREINPRIKQFQAETTQQMNHDASLEGQAAGARAYADEPATAALTSPESASTFAPPSYKRAFSEGYRETVATSMANKSALAMKAAYDEQKNTEGFDREAFVQKWVGNEVHGIEDPLMITTLNSHLAKAVSAIRTEDDALKHARVSAINEQNLQGNLDAMLSPTMDPAKIGEVFHGEIAGPAMKTGQFTRPELALRFASHLHLMSQQNGGRPELFDALNVQDAAGMSPGQSSAVLAEQVQKWRMEAERQRDSKLQQQNLLSNTDANNKFHDAINEGRWDDVSDEKLWQHVSPGGLFNSAGEMQAMRQLRDKAKFGSEKLKAGINAYTSGTAWTQEPEVAKKAYDSIAAAPLASLMQNLGQTGDQANAAVLSAATQLLGISQRGNLGHISDDLKRRIEAEALAVPKDGSQPPASFLQLANLRAAMVTQNPTLADKYFTEDTRDLFDSFNNATTVGKENVQSAYLAAYNGISPESKRQYEQARKADPQFDQKIADKVKGITQDWNWLRAQWMGTYPTNEGGMQAWASIRLKEVMTRNPSLGVDAARDKVQAEAKGIFLREPESNTVVRVPAGMANDSTRDALTRWVKERQAEWGKDSGLAFGFDPSGKMTYQTTNPTRFGNANLADIIKAHALATQMQPEDLTALDNMQKKAAAGTLTAADVNPALVEKLKGMGRWGMAENDKYGRFLHPQGEAAQYKPLPTPNVTNDYAGTSAVDALKTKPQLANKASIANEFLKRGNLHGALTAMGEGVALTAYPDPAGGAGLNIGMGYNKQGNASTWEADFKAAGIPPEANDAIWAGQRSITPEQAMRLYEVVKPRYVATAKAAYEKDGQPGDWAKLPENQQAVLTDLAYQVRDPSAFPKAFAAFRKGDLVTADKEITVSFKDRSGAQRQDVGRHSLRSNMLKSPVNFTDLLNYAAGSNSGNPNPVVATR